MYTKKDFIAVAKILRDTRATVQTVEAFGELFAASNTAFKIETFRSFVWPAKPDVVDDDSPGMTWGRGK